MFILNFQRCKIKFGSWTYNGYQLNVSADHKDKQGDTSKFVKNGEWDLSEFPVTRNEEKYACCPEPYPDVTFTLLIKRRTRYYYINMLLPNMFITGKMIKVTQGIFLAPKVMNPVVVFYSLPNLLTPLPFFWGGGLFSKLIFSTIICPMKLKLKPS